MATPGQQVEASVDADNLYCEDVFTDRQVGSIRRLTPVQKDGSPDPARNTVFVGETSLMTPAGTLPLQFELPGSTLEQAIAAFPDAASKAIEDTMQQLREMQREAASSLVVPGQGGGGMEGLGGAGLPGGGKIQLR